MSDFRVTGPTDAAARFLCAHGAGAGMESPFLDKLLRACWPTRGIAILRFEFAYMAARRQGGSRKPPPKAERLMDEYRAAVAALPTGAPLLIGGKSMGGRVASLVADELTPQGRIAGLVCLGYPFHPPKKPEQLRTAHLAALACPALIVQGERDPFGTRAEVEALRPVLGDPLALGRRRRPRPGPARRLRLHAQGQPRRRRRCDRCVRVSSNVRRTDDPESSTPRTAAGLRPRQALRQQQDRARMIAAETASTRNSASKPQFS